MSDAPNLIKPTPFGHERAGRVWPVGALCLAIADSLQARFNPVTVEGELTGFTRASSGHCYFGLKDASGQLRCAMFKRAAGLMDFQPRDGDSVRVRGRLDVYAPRGDLQMVVESMQRAGQGALFEQFLRLKAKLQEQGLFDSDRKRALPVFPRGIGLVTSLGAAALRDVVTTLARRAPHVPVVLVNAQVQGAAAPTELIAAFNRLRTLTTLTNATEKGDSAPVVIDVVMLVRGGGSIEDLMAFNDEALARVIADFPVPVITGIGHETDFTIADFVADVRAPTPTAAAELVSESQLAWQAVVQGQARRLEDAVLRWLDLQEQRLDGATSRLGRPSDRLVRERLSLGRLEQALSHGMRTSLLIRGEQLQRIALASGQLKTKVLERHNTRLNRAEQSLELLNPDRVLARGFAWLQNEKGQAITEADQVTVNQALFAHLHNGVLGVKVTQRSSPDK